MNYETHTWENGETITAEKLNHIEDGIAEGSDKGYECTETKAVLTEESVDVESEMQGVYVGRLQFVFTNIPSETLSITFNGVKYDCNRISAGDGYAYGGYGEFGPDFSIYPFIIFVGVSELTQLATETAGTYIIKIEVAEESIETSQCFEKAVKAVSLEIPVLRLIEGVTTKQEIEQAYSDGKLMYWVAPSTIEDAVGYYIVTIPDTSQPFAFSKFPTDSGVNLGLDLELKYFSYGLNAG